MGKASTICHEPGKMNRIKALAMLGTLFFFCGDTFAFSKECNQEIKAQCAQVTPGEGRLTSCTFSSHKNFSPYCRVEVYAVIEQRPRFLQMCKSDIGKLCPNVRPVNGRLYSCLKLNEEENINPCKRELF